MTRVLMDNCGTSTVLMSPRGEERGNAGTSPESQQAFHIEGVMFQIRNVNGAMPLPEDRGWKNTVWVDGQVELLVSGISLLPGHASVLLQQYETLEMADRQLDWATVKWIPAWYRIRGGRVDLFSISLRSGL